MLERNLIQSTKIFFFFEHLLDASRRNIVVNKTDMVPILTEPTVGEGQDQ